MECCYTTKRNRPTNQFQLISLIMMGLLLAALLPSSVMADGTVSNESIKASKASSQDPTVQELLFIGSVTSNGKRTQDVAVCHVRRRPLKERSKMTVESVLVAYIKAADTKARAIYTPKEVCKGPSCKSVDIWVDGRNLRITSSDHRQKCADPYRVLRKLGSDNLAGVEITELAPSPQLELDINVRGEVDGGITFVELIGGSTSQICQIPQTHQHVRYGLGWYTSRATASLFSTSNDLYVCSAGVLVCTFSNSFLLDPDNTAIIKGNDLNNTIMTAGITFSDEVRYCRNEAGSSSAEVIDKTNPTPVGSILQSRRYKIDGWREDWRAKIRLFGEGGHDWIFGGANGSTIYGGDGNDLLIGYGESSYLYGEAGLDVMHGGNRGICVGGPPTNDHHCAEGDSTTRWWPYEGDEAGDCCCESCHNNEGCIFSGLTPGVSAPDVPPVPW